MPRKRKNRQAAKSSFEKAPVFAAVATFFILILIWVYLKSLPSAIVFKGITPCADCPGIEETIILKNDNTYTDKNVYLERNTSFTDKGTWKLIKSPQGKSGDIYELTRSDWQKSYYLIKGDGIELLDQDQNPLPSPYNSFLKKQKV